MASTPRTRREQQQQTRDALVVAARGAFAEQGYHGANLETIARDAGFSKGAVYSNFDGKADLFLAVIDANIEVAFAEGGWNVGEHYQAFEGGSDESHGEEASELIEGFALATLEFIATAARDARLREQMGKRMTILVEGYTAVAAQSRSEQDPLQLNELGALLAALDEGAALLSLGGSHAIDQRALRIGMRRLLTPGPIEESTTRVGEPALHDDALRQRLADAIRAGHAGPDAADER
ncbi:TetR/AcrR family transcriptional regulator [Occultella aeris]|uniref:Putative HTH-type transcriptional regulator YfiR n=1 Tax=Occultella aeris TaxID=2761496 RepID=A0A7M4DEL8_9MICO|nr:TetR/AcrR family transcriptional regulator [Occultella aeris]VZO35361.1 putative HTH-type transcriptional regulator YfiR [Occultella aeris]